MPIPNHIHLWSIYLVVLVIALASAWVIVPISLPDLIWAAVLLLVLGCLLMSFIRHAANRVDRIHSGLDRFDHYIADTTRTAL